jgi:hypothetical protein
VSASVSVARFEISHANAFVTGVWQPMKISYMQFDSDKYVYAAPRHWITGPALLARMYVNYGLFSICIEVPMALLDDLLASGYFPKELPPAFSTDSYANAVVSNLPSLPTSFRQSNWVRPVNFTIAKTLGLRRRLTIANPIRYFSLSELIATQWSQIQPHLTSSSLSRSSPVSDPSGARALVPATRLQDLISIRAQNRAHGKYTLVADISEFYPSIYTHTIPWAFHGKAVAKANIGNSGFLGNELDRLTRVGQEGQTVGIPIGPDTSLVLAELILAAVDTAFAARLPSHNGFRWMDEFEMSFTDFSSAEGALAELQHVLADFELRLNPRKTRIDDSPFGFEPRWIREIRSFQFSPSPKKFGNELARYFDLVFAHAKEVPQDYVVRYALSRFRPTTIDASNWPLYQQLISHATIHEMPVVDQYITNLLVGEQRGLGVDMALAGETLNYVIEQTALLEHHHETSWALWGLISLGASLSPKAAGRIEKSENPIVAMLALDALDQGLVPTAFPSALWSSHMTTAELYGEQWLLAYEANQKGWLASVGAADHVNADPNFAFLKGAGVEFYTRVVRPVPPPLSIVGASFALAARSG